MGQSGKHEDYRTETSVAIRQDAQDGKRESYRKFGIRGRKTPQVTFHHGKTLPRRAGKHGTGEADPYEARSSEILPQELCAAAHKGTAELG